MTENEQWKRFVVRSLCLSALLYVLVCGAITLAVTYNHPYRNLNVRDFPVETWKQLNGAYIEHNMTKDALVFAGSSFSYGYAFAADLTVTRHLSQLLNRPVINVSMIGSAMAGYRDYIFCPMKERALHAKSILVEIPLINEMSRITVTPEPAPCPNRPWSMFETIARFPSRSMWTTNLSDAYRKARTDHPDVVINPVKDGYFASPAIFEANKSILADRITKTLSEAAEVADEVYAFVTPVYGEGVTGGGQDRSNVEAQFEFAQAICKSVLKDRCVIGTHLLNERSIYSNLTHLAIRGMEPFAQHLAATIKNHSSQSF